MRLTVVAAAPGYGKTSAIRRRSRSARWCAGEAAADFIRTRRWAPQVVLDMPAVSSDELREWLKQTPCEQVTLITRTPFEWDDCDQIGPVDLALPEAAVAPEVFRATLGWPALAQRWPDHEGYVRSTVMPSLSRAARQLVMAFARLGPVRRGLCVELGVDPAAMVELTRLGVLVDGALVPAVAEAVEPGAVNYQRAATWYARNGFPAAAAHLHDRLGQHRCLATLLAERGGEILAAEPRVFGKHPLLRSKARALSAVHVSQAASLFAESRYPEALKHADLAVHLFEDRSSLLVRGRVLGRLGRFEDALQCFERAEAPDEIAQLHRDYGRAAHDPRELEAEGTRPSLTAALRHWHQRGAELDTWRVTASLGALEDATVAERLAAREARVRLEAAGVVVSHGSAVVVRTFGRFEVRVDEVEVPSTAWQSRKARDLLRILIVRRGRGIAREELAALLWDDGSSKVSHRLSVALSIVRQILDPARKHAVDHYVHADQASVALNPARLDIDLERFLAEADHGLRLRDPAVLQEVERLYRGELFEDEPYDSWADAVREQARALYLRVVRTLAELHNGDTDAVRGYLHRLLANDPYDEQAHLDLIDALATAGCHGEAQRARTRYEQAMAQVA